MKTNPIVLSILLLPSVAAADKTTDAEKLFNDARSLSTKGHYAEACSKYEESQSLDPGVGTLLYLADCYDHTEQPNRAWKTFREAETMAHASGQHDRAQIAHDAAAAIDPKLAKLKIVLGYAPAPEIRLDGQLVPADTLGVAVPMDPGPHTIEATSPGKERWVTAADVRLHSVLTIEVPRLADVSAARPGPALSPAAPQAPMPPKKHFQSLEPAPLLGIGTQRTVAIGVAGVGLGGIVAGSILGMSAKSTYDSSSAYCQGNHCLSQGLEARDSAYTKATISTLAFAGGALAIGGGAALWFTAPSVQVKPVVGVGSFAVQGVW